MKKYFFVLAFLVAVIISPAFGMAKTVTIDFQVDDTVSDSATEIRLYEDAGDGYGDPIDTLDPSETTVSFTIPDDDACYSYVMSTYNSIYDVESDMSNEASVCISDGVAVFPTIPTVTILSITVTD